MLDLRSLASRLRASRASRAIVIRTGAVAIGLVQSIVVARLGGPELRGVVAVFVSASSLIYLAASFDVGQQVVSMCRQRGDFAPVRPLMRVAWLIYGAVAALIALVFLTLDSAVSWLAIGGVAYLMGSQSGLVLGAMRGPVASAWASLSQQVVLLVGVLAVAGAGVLDSSTVKVVVIASFLTPVPFFWLLVRGGRGEGASKSGGTDSAAPTPLRRLTADVVSAAAAGFPWQLGRSLQWSVMLIDTILVAHYLGDAAAGIYAVGFSLTIVPRLVGGQIAVDVYHRATVADEHAIDRDLGKTLLGATIAATAVAVVAPFVVNVLYGPEFAEGLPVYLVLTVSVIAQALVQVSYQFTRVYGRPWPTVAYSALGPMLMLALGGWALAAFGVVGMAWVSSAASLLMAVPAVILARRLERTVEQSPIGA